ncbi:MAG: hypothetical protein AB7N91_14110 [Candidatus Tectimicrobiota bacterium]
MPSHYAHSHVTGANCPVTLRVCVPSQVAQLLQELSEQQHTTMSALIVESIYLRLGLPRPARDTPLARPALPARHPAERPTSALVDPADRVLKALREMPLPVSPPSQSAGQA